MTPEKVLKSGPTDSILLIIGRKLSYLTFWEINIDICFLFLLIASLLPLDSVAVGVGESLQARLMLRVSSSAPEIVKHTIVPLHSWNHQHIAEILY